MPSLIAKMQVLLILEENFLKNRNLTFPVVRYFTWKLVLVSNILWLIVDSCPCNNTLWNLLERKSLRRLRNFPRIPKDSNLNKSPWCQTLSKALDNSKNIPLTSSDGLQLKARYILWVIEINWLIQLSLAQKADWLIFGRFSRSM